MAEAHDLLCLGPAQDADHMRYAEALAGVLDRRQYLLRVLGHGCFPVSSPAMAREYRHVPSLTDPAGGTDAR